MRDGLKRGEDAKAERLELLEREQKARAHEVELRQRRLQGEMLPSNPCKFPNSIFANFT